MDNKITKIPKPKRSKDFSVDSKLQRKIEMIEKDLEKDEDYIKVSSLVQLHKSIISYRNKNDFDSRISDIFEELEDYIISCYSDLNDEAFDLIPNYLLER